MTTTTTTTTSTTGQAVPSRPVPSHPVWSAAARGALRALVSATSVLVVIVALWVLLLAVVDVPDFVAKGPGDVWAYLVTGPDAAEHRALVADPLRQTLLDAGIGFAAGMLAAVVLASGIVLSRGVEAGVMPVAMVLRSVPLVALAPIIAMIFGNGFLTVAVMSGIVVLFPALVSIVFGLRSVTPQMSDVIHVYGGGSWTALRKVAFPSALPALFASVRISVPGAITGALIAESLATGKGVGHAVTDAVFQFHYDEVWGLVVAITVVSVLLYTLAQLVEGIVLARFGRA